MASEPSGQPSDDRPATEQHLNGSASSDAGHNPRLTVIEPNGRSSMMMENRSAEHLKPSGELPRSEQKVDSNASRFSTETTGSDNHTNVSLYAPSTVSRPNSPSQQIDAIPASPALSTSRISYDSASFSPTQSSLMSPSNLTLTAQYNNGASSIDSGSVRRASTTSSTSMLSLRRDLTSLGFNKSSIATNAIATLLNSPSARAAAWSPTIRDIPPVVLTNLNIVPPEAFNEYLDSITSEFEKYQHIRGPGTEGFRSVAVSPRKGIPQRGDSLGQSAPSSFVDMLDNRLLKSAPTTEDGADKKAGDGKVRHSKKYRPIPVTPLSTIPQVYFDANFKLENPRIFDVVTERSEILSAPTPTSSISSTPTASSSSSTVVSKDPHSPISRKSLANNAILQEKLSWYLDTVEVHLINEISKASPSFFAALGDLRNLHVETANAVSKISGLREDLRRVDLEQAEVGLEIVRLQKRKENVRKLEQAVAQMSLVSDVLAEAENFWKNDDADACWDTTFKVDNVVSGGIPLSVLQQERSQCKNWKFPLSDLSSVPAIAAVRDQQTSLRNCVINEYQVRFTSCLLEDIRRHVASVPTQETLDRLSRTYSNSRINRSAATSSGAPPPINNSYLNLPARLKPDVASYMQGLAKIGSVDSGVRRYRDAIMREVKNLIKRNLPTNANDDASSVASSATGRTATTAQKSATLERMLREMRPQEFEDMLVDIFTGVSELLRRLSMHQKLLLDITSSMDTILDISDLLTEVADITQARTVRIINVRRDLNAYQDPSLFASFYNLNRVFLAECEAITGKFGTALLNTVKSLQPPPPPNQLPPGGRMQESLERRK
ncbi:hypothetical protein BZA70DRAFT_116210 [Myxozyma melibiosi]|uniref:Uncharacterized protein n=1 Tax=Myxozyma melibiosi TaxID=54550 RepID=A0ABR1FAJ7_9ASCO